MYLGSSTLVGGGISIRGLGKTDAGAGGIEYAVEPLGEWVAINKIKPSATGRTNIVNNEVDGVATATNVRVENTRPDLAVRGESVCFLCKW